MNVEEYVDKLLEDPTQEKLEEYGSNLKQLVKKLGSTPLAYEVKIFAKEIKSIASFASPKATVLQWSDEKIKNYIIDKKNKLSKKALEAEVPGT